MKKYTLYHCAHDRWRGHENTLRFASDIRRRGNKGEKNNRSPSEFDSLDRGTRKDLTF